MRLWIALLLIVTLAAGADPPSARLDAHLDPPGAATVGQSVRLVVDVWVTTWFLDAPQLPSLNVPGAAVTLPEAARHLNEQRDGVSWFGIERAYVITPTQAGELRVDSFSVSVRAGPDGNPQTLQTAPLSLHVRGGAAGSSLITPHLDLHQDIQRSARSLKVGDSITRTVTQTASAAQAMLLPPVHFDDIDGLALYAAPPRVETVNDERGGFVGGRRVDAATYVAQRAGRYHLPAVTVHWWDSTAQTLRTSSAPAVTVNIAPNRHARADIAVPGANLLPDGIYRYALLLVLVAILTGVLWLLLWVCRNGWPWLLLRLRRWRAHWRDSELWAWRNLRRLAHANDAARIYPALCRWVSRLPAGPEGPAALARRCGDETLLTEVARLEQNLYADRRQNWSAATLVAHCARARRSVLRAAHSKPRALAPLNPE